ncbi:MAG TPA: glycosyltransferase family 9 protein [Spirochaetota bacterium]|nr:glycosyltransferase family 9 protein [Spirochaetota bacterium]HPN82182.1 glycosyltransferase family 9 protein [Spirochaetota bacterium]
MKIRGNTLLRILDRFIGPCILLVARFLPLAREHNHPRRRILVLTNSAMGDAVVLSGVLREAMKRLPNAEWHIAASPLVHDVLTLAGLHYAAADLDFARPLGSLKTIRNIEADIAIDIGQWSRTSAILARCSGAVERIGFTRKWQGRRAGFTTTVCHQNTCHEVVNFFNLFSALHPSAGFSVSDCTPSISPPADFTSSFPETNADHVPDQLLVLHLFPGGTASSMKELNGEQSSTLIKALISAGYRIALTGGPENTLRAAEIIRAASFPEKKLTSACGWRVRETANLIRRARAVISVNTGIMHLAAAIGTPLVAIHGPTNPVRWGPLGDKKTIRVVSSQAGCLACLDLGGEYACHPGREQPACMRAVVTSDILSALESVISGHTRKGDRPF